MQRSFVWNRQQLLVAFLCFTAVCGYIYENPKAWPETSYFCGSCLQSPINIITAHTERISLNFLRLSNYNKETTQSTLENDGDTVHINVDPLLNATVTGSNLNEVYQAERVYFHWGKKSDLGTEHAFNFVHKALEMQIYHRNVAYPTTRLAMRGVNGYLAFSVLFTEVENDSTMPMGMRTICDHIISIRNSTRASVTLPRLFNLESLFTGLDMGEYYTYCGSHTIPPCSPNVIWIVFPNTLHIGKQCLYKFRSVVSNAANNMTITQRPLQATGARRIFYNVL